MKVERLDVVGIGVRDLERAKHVLSDLFEVRFRTVEVDAPGGKKMSVALDDQGYFSLIPAEQEGLRNLHFKVQDLAAATAEMERKGIPLVSTKLIGGVKEAIFDAQALFGVRICLVEYEGPSLLQAAIAEQEPGRPGR